MKISPILSLALVATVIAAAGCQTTGSGKQSPQTVADWFKPADKEKEMDPPVRMAVIWKDAIYEEPGQRPVRGMSGRVFFYNQDDEAVKVDGDLVVYGYDDSNSETNVADRKFVFPAERFQDRYHASDLGHSYSIWVPWDEAGGVRKNVSFVPVFKGRNGQILKAGQTLCVLPGRAPEPVASSDPNIHSTRTLGIPGWTESVPGKEGAQTSYVADSSHLQSTAFDPLDDSQFLHQTSHVRTDRRIRTTTINVPRGLAERMKSAPGNANSPTVLKPNHDEPNPENHAARMAEKIRAMKAEMEARKSGEAEQERPSFSPNPFLRDTSGKFPANPPAFGKPGQFQ